MNKGNASFPKYLVRIQSLIVQPIFENDNVTPIAQYKVACKAKLWLNSLERANIMGTI